MAGMIGMAQTIGVYHYGYFMLKARDIQCHGPTHYPRPEILRGFPQYCAEASNGYSGLMWHEMANVDMVGLMED